MKKDHSFLIVILIIGIITVIAILSSCEKDDVHDWRLKQQMLVYRAKCGPDSINIIRTEKAKTDAEIVVIMHSYDYQRWMKKSELLFIPIYEVLELQDSVYVESSIINCGYLICI